MTPRLMLAHPSTEDPTADGKVRMAPPLHFGTPRPWPKELHRKPHWQTSHAPAPLTSVVPEGVTSRATRSLPALRATSLAALAAAYVKLLLARTLQVSSGLVATLARNATDIF
eukprot:9473628-Pyramimonas_sp.AAC.1